MAMTTKTDAMISEFLEGYPGQITRWDYSVSENGRDMHMHIVIALETPLEMMKVNLIAPKD